MLRRFWIVLVVLALAFAPVGAAAQTAAADEPQSKPELLAGYEWPDEPPREHSAPDDTAPTPPPPVAWRPTRFTDRPLALEAMLGFGTPVGLIGGVLEFSLIDPIAVGAGLGTGAAGPEGALILNLRPFFWNGRVAAQAIGTTVAWSGGNWDDRPPGLPDMGHESSESRALEQHRTYGFVQWVQVDAGYELRTRGGFVLRVAYGVAWLVTPGNFECRIRNGDEVPCSAALQERLKPFRTSILTSTLTLGYAFDT